MKIFLISKELGNVITFWLGWNLIIVVHLFSLWVLAAWWLKSCSLLLWGTSHALVHDYDVICGLLLWSKVWVRYEIVNGGECLHGIISSFTSSLRLCAVLLGTTSGPRHHKVRSSLLFECRGSFLWWILLQPFLHDIGRHSHECLLRIDWVWHAMLRT